MLVGIIEEVSGQSYTAYLEEHVIAPLGMENTSFEASDYPHEQLAIPYEDFGTNERSDLPLTGMTALGKLRTGGTTTTYRSRQSFSKKEKPWHWQQDSKLELNVFGNRRSTMKTRLSSYGSSTSGNRRRSMKHHAIYISLSNRGASHSRRL
jgi:CubicO group peptidase (beta-lactamase class C family)